MAPGFADFSIACIAPAGGLVMATGHGRDFAPIGIGVRDPLRGGGGVSAAAAR